jgi:hypothetical protein
MRKLLTCFVLAAAAVLAGCSDPQPPLGRWEGVYDGDDAMIVARLEIVPDAIRVSAPNAFAAFSAMADAERQSVQRDLARRLAAAWPNVAPSSFTFDGKIFRKPGGVAPQMEWDPDHKQMTLVVYPGLHDTIRLSLRAVEAFGEDS